MQRPSLQLSPTEGRDEGSMWLEWLVRLRWVAIVAQSLTLSFVVGMLAYPAIVIPLLLGVIVVLGVGNLVAQRILARQDTVEPIQLLTQLALDVVALTVFFLCAGGPDNPFVPLYVIHVAMGAVMLRPAAAAQLAAMVVGCYAVVHQVHLPLHLERHTLSEQTLVRLGQALSFTITVTSVLGFVVGTSNSLRRHKLALLEARDRTARTDRLRSVGTMAAGAAHELNTPLSTLVLRLRRVARRHEDAETVRDVEVMRTQLERCKRVVEQLLVGAGDPSASGISRAPMGALVAETLNLWSKGSPLEVDVDDSTDDAPIEVPPVAFSQALINLLENARQAQETASRADPLALRLYRDRDRVVLELADHGCGLPEVAERVGEPFYTTKANGTGLGVYVARAVADGAGGGLSYSSSPDGTIARWWFPEARRSP